MGDREQDQRAAAERWGRVRALLEQALELPAAERAELLAGCSDAGLRAEVERLLAREPGSSRWFERPPDLSSPGAPQEPGAGRLGAYRLVREIGAGGMGTVWLAVRGDGQFKKQVALKRIHAGLATPEILERFRRERQVLANLDHPGIARLIDGGEDEEGRPYLVVEHVEGAPIDRWCDENGLTVEERVDLFREVCAAVEHAHANLVVHRDLKPSNVLVTPEGRVKLLDFGIAKVLDPEKLSASPELTVGLARFLTPAYACPEQVRGGPITTRSDVYSLGVILYLLLTGRLPYRLEGRTAGEIERIVCEQEPPAPSAALRARPAEDGSGQRPSPEEVARRRSTSARGLGRLLSGDLGRIVLEALRKEPRRRYGSVVELSDDLRRWSEGLPVRARADTLGYRASRFVRRNRAGVSAAALVLVALSVALVASLTGYRRAVRAAAKEEELRTALETRLAEEQRLTAALAEQRLVAEQRTADVRRFATTLVFDVHRVIANLSGSSEAQWTVLETGIGFLDELAAGAEGDGQLLRELAGGWARMGSVLASPGSANLGRAEEGLRCLDKAQAAAESALALDREDPANAFALAQACGVKGEVLGGLGRFDEERAIYEHALDACRSVPEERLDKPGLFSCWADLHDRLAARALGNSRKAEALEHLDHSREILLRLREGWPDLTSAYEGLANNDLRRSLLFEQQGELALAVEAARRALDAYADLGARDPSSLAFERGLGNARLQLARLLAARGERAEAVGLLERQLEALDERRARGPGDARTLRDVELVHDELARTLREDEPRRALEHFLSGLGIAREIASRDERNVFLDYELATSLLETGALESDLGEQGPAIERLEEARGLLADVSRRAPRFAPVALTRCLVLGALGKAHLRLAGDPGSIPGPARAHAETAARCFEQGLELFASETAAGRRPQARDDVEEKLRNDLESARARLLELGGE